MLFVCASGVCLMTVGMATAGPWLVFEWQCGTQWHRRHAFPAPITSAPTGPPSPLGTHGIPKGPVDR
uniref:Putative secreted peptide n=1 Tax=Anopheles braziliensis TaxID=58242 RepID=A0A2M3ZXK9_9DIPT